MMKMKVLFINKKVEFIYDLNQSSELNNAVHIIKNAILNSQERALGLVNQE